MDKNTFMRELERSLSVLQESELRDILSEYEQHIDMKVKSGLSEEEAVKRLFELGAVSRRGCERLAIREEVARLEKRGMGRCEALHVAAGVFCCSYEKARNAFYNTFKD